MSKYSASVIIPTFNRLDELELTLDSLVHQNCMYTFEVIIADDGSAENTKGLVDEYLEKLNIRYCFQKDKGFRAGTARNMGIKLADSDICIFIDNGIILHSKAIENHIFAHINETDFCLVIGYVYGFMVESDKEKELATVIEQNMPDEAVQLLCTQQLYDYRECYYQTLGEDLTKWPAPFVVCWSCNISTKRSTLLKFGMFDDFFVGWGDEDIDLGITLYKNGVKFILDRSIKSIHIPHEKTGTIKPENVKTKKHLHELHNQLKRDAYIRAKHTCHAVDTWLYAKDPLATNQILLGTWQGSG